MKLKYFAFVLTLTSLTVAHSAARNLCDDLAENGTSTSEQVKKCQEARDSDGNLRFGVSQYAKEKEIKKIFEEQAAKDKEDLAKANVATEEEKKNNLEIKNFSEDDLFEAGFGKSFFAIKTDYTNPSFPVEKRITDGDALCSYLGYEKSIKSSISSKEIMPQTADKMGLIVDTRWLTGSAKDPELYRDENWKSTVKKYVGITCVKRKNKKIDPSNEAYKKLVEDIVVLPGEVNPTSKDTTSEVDNSSRSGKVLKTPHSFDRPGWMKDSTPGQSK